MKDDGFKLEDNYFDYGSHKNTIIVGKK